MRTTILLGVGAAACLWGMPVAAATFTLDSTITIDGTEAGNGPPDVLGEIRPVFDTSGVILFMDGTVSLGTQDVFIVEIELFGGSADVDQLGISVFGPAGTNPEGAGSFDDAGRQDPNGPPEVTADSTVNFAGIFNFDFLGVSAGNLEAGETSVRLFTTFAQGDLTEGDLAIFMISSGTDFSVSGTIIPEPATATLLGLGLAGLAFAGRRKGNG